MDQERRIEYFMSEISRLSNQVVDLQYERDALAARLSEIEKSDSQEVLSLKADNQALAATVEALREMANRANVHLTKGYAGQSFSAIDCNLALSALAEIDSFTPQQHLAEIMAQAGRDGFFKGVAWILDIDVKDISAMVAEEAANQYAENIRQGGAK